MIQNDVSGEKLIEMSTLNNNIVFKTTLNNDSDIVSDNNNLKFYGASAFFALTGVILLLTGNLTGLIFAKILLTTSVPVGVTPLVIEQFEETKNHKNLKIWNGFLLDLKLTRNQYNFYNKNEDFKSIYNYLKKLLNTEDNNEFYILNKRQVDFLMTLGDDFLDHIKLYYRNLVFVINYTHNVDNNQQLFDNVTNAIELIIMDTFYYDIYRYSRITSKKLDSKFVSNKFKIDNIKFLDVDIDIIIEYFREFTKARTSFYKISHLNNIFNLICKSYPRASSDDLLDILIYIITKSSLDDPYSQIWLISNFNLGVNSGDSDDYIYTTFQSAINFITNYK